MRTYAGDHKLGEGRYDIFRPFLIEWVLLYVDVRFYFWFLEHADAIEFENNVMRLLLLNIDVLFFGINAEHEIIRKNSVAFFEVFNLFV